MSSLRSLVHDEALLINSGLHESARVLHNGPTKLRTLVHSKASTKNKITSQPIYYSSIFEKVYNKRLGFYKRICFLISCLVAIVLTFLSSSASFFMLPFKIVLVFGSFIFIESLREITMTVIIDPSYRSLGKQVFAAVISKKFANILLGFSVASLCYFITLFFQIWEKSFTYYVNPPTRTIKPFINDEFIFFWYHWAFATFTYSLYHSIYLKNMLNFKFGVFQSNPKSTIFENHITIVQNSGAITAIVTFLLPISYRIVRPIIYKIFLYPVYWPLGLNHKTPLAKLSFSMIVYLLFLDGILFYSWELVNHIYNVYATIGCIDKGKPLSSLSKDPVNTLLSGLRDSKRPLVKLTAFQELGFISTSEDPKLREFLYSAHFKNVYVWQSVLEECSLVIEETSKRIRARPKTLKSNGTAKTTDEVKPNIFGNSKSGPRTVGIENNSHYSLKPEEMVSLTDSSRSKFSIVKEDMEPIDLKKFTLPLLKTLNNYYIKLLHSNLGKLVQPSIKREAYARISNPSNYGNAIISIAHIALNAEFEDKNNIVISTLPEILSLLEKAVFSTKNFINFPPVEVATDEENPIVEFHDLSLKLFFEIVVKYNHMLNDFVLAQPVFNLSKWCIDLAIKQQQEQDL